jgi:hypothetical protein
MKKYIILIACSLIFISSVQAGGPWPQKKGKAYIKISEWWVVFNQHYTGSGGIDPNVTTGIFNTALYAEYGFTDRLTGIAYAPLLSRNYINNVRSNTTQEIITQGEAINAFGDIDLGIKYGLTKKGSKIPISATLFLGIPTGKSSAGIEGNLQTGDGEFNQMLQIDAGTSFQLGKKKKVNSYVSAYVGFNNRTKQFSEEFRYGLEYGVGFFNNKLWLAAKLNAVESFKNGATAETTTSTSLFANNAEYVSYSLDVAYYVTKKVGFSLGYASAFKGEIIAAAPSYSVGVFLDLSK